MDQSEANILEWKLSFGVKSPSIITLLALMLLWMIPFECKWDNPFDAPEIILINWKNQDSFWKPIRTLEITCVFDKVRSLSQWVSEFKIFKSHKKNHKWLNKNWALDGAKASNVKIMIHQLWMTHGKMTHADSLWFNVGSTFDAVFWFIINYYVMIHYVMWYDDSPL